MVNIPLFARDLYIPGGWEWDFGTINRNVPSKYLNEFAHIVPGIYQPCNMKVTGWLHFASRMVPARPGVNNTRLGGLKEMATVQQVISLEKMTEDTEVETWFHPKKMPPLNRNFLLKIHQF